MGIKSRDNHKTWSDDDPKEQKLNIVSDEDRERYKLQLEKWTKETSNDKRSRTNDG